MPWCADTLQQWERDLTRTKREVMSSDRAVGFFARLDASTLPPPTMSPRAVAALAQCPSSSDSHSEALDTAELEESPQGSSQPEAEGVAWVHKGGVARIHASFCEGLACDSSKPVTTAYERGIARTKEEAELATNAFWCRRCANIVW